MSILVCKCVFCGVNFDTDEHKKPVGKIPHKLSCEFYEKPRVSKKKEVDE